VDEFGFTHFSDGSFLNDRNKWFNSKRIAKDGSSYDEYWNYIPPRHHNNNRGFRNHQDDLVRDFEDQLDEDDDFDDDDPLYQEFLRNEGKFEKDLSKHKYPLSIVIRDLPD